MSDVFDLLDRPLMWIPVRWPGLKPGPDGGVAVPTEHEIEVEVELLDDKEEFTKVFGLDDPAQRKEGETDPTDFDAFKRVVKNWRKLTANKIPVEFTDENIRRVLRLPNFATSLQVAYLNALAGRVETREGNSESSPANGRAGDSDQSTKQPRAKAN